MKIKKYNDDPSGYIVTNLSHSYEVSREGVELQDIIEETGTTTGYRATIESIPGKLEHGAFAKVKLQKGMLIVSAKYCKLIGYFTLVNQYVDSYYTHYNLNN